MWQLESDRVLTDCRITAWQVNYLKIGGLLNQSQSRKIVIRMIIGENNPIVYPLKWRKQFFLGALLKLLLTLRFRDYFI